MTDPAHSALTAEDRRLEEDRARQVHWKRWGPYLSDRQWGTVREDYSDTGEAWAYFPHDHARSRAYRWGEDGLLGVSDRRQFVCFALALWNGKDPILKERLFGLSNAEGNHGEDVKEIYFYLDSTPTHSYMKALYKYPQTAFPYDRLVKEGKRAKHEPEFEITDTDAFKDRRYWDVVAEYAKAGAEDLLVRLTVHNRGPDTAPLWLLPTLWFRNTWSWGRDPYRPELRAAGRAGECQVIEVDHRRYGMRRLLCGGEPELLFTENETNTKRLWGRANRTPYVKDAFHEAIVHKKTGVVNPYGRGTKAAALYRLSIEPGASAVFRLRFTDEPAGELDAGFDRVFQERIAEADAFYAQRLPANLPAALESVQRQSFGGLLWTKQFYHLDVRTWLEGDPLGPVSSPARRKGRNREWIHLYNDDVISMPDKWEYPWYAAWDLAFHTIPLAQVDPDFAKDQLILLLREWYMHPNGQLPAYEWALGDVNPPVHAAAAWRVYKIERRLRGKADRAFLERVFHKLLLNFTWWTNRKDEEGNNLFQGGFLGLDNIGIFDRSKPLPTGGRLEQSDGTSWMGMYCLNMLVIAGELAREDPAYEDIASKFFEHFIHITHAMNAMGEDRVSLWDEEDGFYYDVLHLPDGTHRKIKIRSMVGLIPLFAAEVLEPEILDRFPGFKKRMQWFLENHPEAPNHVAFRESPAGQRRFLALVPRDRLVRILTRLLDETEFLSPYGVRALSRRHMEEPYRLQVNGHVYSVGYEPGESTTGDFGGNSNWRGPIWFPVNVLLIESLQRHHHFYGDEVRVECPTGSGRRLNLDEVARELSRRLIRLFVPGPDGRRPVNGGIDLLDRDPHTRDHVLFHEYFHGDTGRGLGASHQTGWTALVSKLIEQSGGDIDAPGDGAR